MSAPAVEIDLALPLASMELRVAVVLPRGVTAVMGPSGAGKTSLLEAIAGLRPRASGRVAVAGEALLDTARGVALPPERRRVGYVPQDAGLFPHLDALANVRYGARDDPAAVDAAIDTLELRPLLGRRPRSLSGDELPLAALDAGLRDRVLPWLLRVRDAWDVPCLYVTHGVGEALAAARHALVLRAGRVAASGEPRALLGAPALEEEAREGIENLLPARVVAHDAAGGITRVRTATGLEVAVTLAEARAAGDAVTLALRAEDVLVASGPVPGLSARNAYPGRVASIERPGADALLRCALDAGGELLARVTPAAVAELGLAPGAPVVLAVKSHSIRLIGPSGPAAPASSSGSAGGTSAAASPGRTPRG